MTETKTDMKTESKTGKGKLRKHREHKPLIQIEIPQERRPVRWTLPADILALVADYQHYQIELAQADEKRVPEEAIVEAILRAHFGRDRHFKTWAAKRGDLEPTKP